MTIGILKKNETRRNRVEIIDKILTERFSGNLSIRLWQVAISSAWYLLDFDKYFVFINVTKLLPVTAVILHTPIRWNRPQTECVLLLWAVAKGKEQITTVEINETMITVSIRIHKKYKYDYRNCQTYSTICYCGWIRIVILTSGHACLYKRLLFAATESKRENRQ